MLTTTTFFESVSAATIQPSPHSQRPYVDGRTIKNALLLGFNSTNGYTYAREAASRALTKFEGARIYADHTLRGDPKAAKNRSVRDLVGRASNVWLSESGVRGDVTLVDSELGRSVLSVPEAYGLSAVSDVQMAPGGRTVVEIRNVYSVDLVSNPATSRHLMESSASGATPARTLRDLYQRTGLQWDEK